MAYTLPPANFTNGSQGLEALIIYEVQQVPLLGPGLLLFVFFIIFGAGYFSQERKVGRGNFPMWLSIAGLITTTGGFVLFLYSGIINLETIIICMVLTILFSLWFLMTSRDG